MSRQMRATGLGVLVISLSCATLPPAPTPRALEDVLPAALEGVVLLINQRPDGKIGYGAGVLVGDEGLVLTNLHVVANARTLGAMLYEPARPSHTPLDGGLARYIFEHRKSVVPVRLIRGDPALDLAVVHLDTPTNRFRKLVVRADPPRPGERVIALGHPKEAVWSFTSGVVSGIPRGAIQHDAAINQGNSGGALIDAEGRLLGINTFKLVGDADGIAFARPLTMAQRLLGTANEKTALDLSSPEAALRSCSRLLEMGDAAYAECFDLGSLFSIQRKELDAHLATLRPDAAKLAQLRASHPQLFELREFEASYRRLILSILAHDDLAAALSALHDLKGQQLREVEIATTQAARELSKDYLERNGLKLDAANPSATLQLVKLGQRVDAVVHDGAAAAWALIRGRNDDGTEYAYSTRLSRQADQWRERVMVLNDELQGLPKGWPPPLSNEDDYRKQLAVGIRAGMQLQREASETAR